MPRKIRPEDRKKTNVRTYCTRETHHALQIVAAKRKQLMRDLLEEIIATHPLVLEETRPAMHLTPQKPAATTRK